MACNNRRTTTTANSQCIFASTCTNLRCIHYTPTPWRANLEAIACKPCRVPCQDNSVQTSRVCSMQTDKCRVFTGFDSKVQLKVRAPISFVSLPLSSCMPSLKLDLNRTVCKRRKTHPLIFETTHIKFGLFHDHTNRTKFATCPLIEAIL